MKLVNFENMVRHSINKKIGSDYGLVFYKVYPRKEDLYIVGHTKINFDNGLCFDFDTIIIDDGRTTFKKDYYTICTIDKTLKSFVVGVNPFGDVVVASNFILEDK